MFNDCCPVNHSGGAVSVLWFITGTDVGKNLSSNLGKRILLFFHHSRLQAFFKLFKFAGEELRLHAVCLRVMNGECWLMLKMETKL